MAKQQATVSTTATGANVNPWRIVVVQAGWVLVGRHEFNRETGNHQLTNASVIRVWGTTGGLGELALSGPRKETVLEPSGVACIPDGSTLFTLECNDAVWTK